MAEPNAFQRLLHRFARRESYISTKIEETHRSRATALDLSGQGLTQLPEPLGQLTQLRELFLSSDSRKSLNLL
jgi:Leucine-rich repeat (LRR) protein